MAEIKFENVSKSFGKTTVIENMNLTLPDGKFTVLLGPSGCGKTTLLRMIAGIGPGAEAQAHAPNEITWKQDLVTCAAVYALLPSVYCKD